VNPDAFRREHTVPEGGIGTEKRKPDGQEDAMEMPVVSECRVTPCAYNRDSACHALAITVGEAERAQCDTFFSTSAKGGDASATARVGACKMANCRHNADLQCQAAGITVDFLSDEADCLTYAAR
jgi:hypothetical protein